MSRRVALVCPGRGTYTKSELGFFSKALPARAAAETERRLAHADAVRAARGDASLRELDGAAAFGARHLAGENAGALIYACTATDALRIDPAKAEVVAVCGNSMGWYTALHVAGALDFEAGFTLADGMGAMQKDGVIGGQLITPVVDDAWRPDPARRAEVEAALADVAAAGAAVGWSIRLGGFAVLWGDADGVKRLLAALPKRKLGEREYPFQLQGHSAFHSPLLEGVSAKARARFGELPWRAPAVPLIDGRGRQHRPLTADPRALLDYTVGEQIVATYDFTASIRVVLRDYAPDRLVLLGPGDTLGGAIAQTFVEEGWQGLRSKADFAARQKEDPILVAMARDEQAALVS
ncbi:MAG TPA: ACP S-malonyltransferase [Planctomycetota bacterium]|nr:ACP S-malonyltransferase [Planctomycetota bacterium]